MTETTTREFPLAADDSLRGTADDPLVINHPQRNHLLLEAANHVHDQNGRCVKNRFDRRCPDPDPATKVEDVLTFAKETLGLELLPWQEDFLRAAIEGRHTFEHKVRNRTTNRLGSHTFGFFESAKNWVDDTAHPHDWEIVSRPAFPYRSLK